MKKNVQFVYTIVIPVENVKKTKYRIDSKIVRMKKDSKSSSINKEINKIKISENKAGCTTPMNKKLSRLTKRISETS